MSVEDDQAWLDALAGAAPADGVRSPAVLEALALRELIRTQQGGARAADARTEVAIIDPRREEELIARARAAGLLPQAGQAGQAAQASGVHAGRARAGKMPAEGVPAAGRRRFGGRRATLTAAAATLAVAAVLLLPRHPAETFRGTENGVVHLQSADPAALKRRLTDELGAAGIHAVGYRRLGHEGIDADLPQPLTGEAREVLERHHIPIPADGALVVEIDAPSAR
ncbi:MAG TPA: hypothetical protein VHZ53_06705 [Steroidobacteraceae bacterium]|jgi:hypothetical protein|nr:hypothetical protein [Steroidobacteraceae bacterium]